MKLTIAILCGLAISAWTTRFFYFVPAGQIHVNHEESTYIERLIDFREALETGHYSPQWSTYMHSGLGGPYFSYYQPGFFYLASLFPHRLSSIRAIGLAIFAMLLLGFVGMWHLVARRFGAAPGLAAAVLFVLSTYAGTEIWVRGDFSELTAMMLLPLQMDALLEWRRTRTMLSLAVLASITCAVLISHAPVAFVTLIVIGVYLFIEDLLNRRSLRTALLDGIAIVCGVLLAAFYWFPVVFEWNLVQPEKAFSGFYLYSNHFVGLRSLVGSVVDARYLVPVALGFPLLSSLAFGVVLLFGRRQPMSSDQRELIRLLICFASLSGFLLLRFSQPVWASVPMLYRVQFPWRLLTLLTMSLSGLGSLWIIAANRFRWVSVCALTAAAFYFYPYGYPQHLQAAELPSSPAGLISLAYAPDGANEWLPRGAPAFPPNPFPELTSSDPACRADEFERAQSKLILRVDATRGCAVRLAHYYFPVGWTATFLGRTLAIEDQEGWMALRFPEGGRGTVVVTFTRTPARQWGLWLSFATAILLAAAVVWERAKPRFQR